MIGTDIADMRFAMHICDSASAHAVSAASANSVTTEANMSLPSLLHNNSIFRRRWRDCVPLCRYTGGSKNSFLWKLRKGTC